MLGYPIERTKDDNGTWLVTVPDVPEVAAVAENDDQIEAQALDALEAALEIYISDRRPIPAPSKPKRGQTVVHLPALVAAKAALADEMLKQGVRKADLARLMNVNQVQIDRLLKLGHPSKIETVESALRLLGKRLELSVA